PRRRPPARRGCMGWAGAGNDDEAGRKPLSSPRGVRRVDDATNVVHDADDADEAVGGAGGSSRPGALVGAIDTHCHLYLMDAEPQAAVRQAQDAGVATLVCVGIDPETSARSLEL